jgi:arabinose-5-phosphate isomerase
MAKSFNSNNENILEYASSVLETEAKAISAIIPTINDSFSHAVELILATSKQGHVIVSGMGKAGFVGMKISATFASTGVPSFFLHPAEALHGDLGRYRKTDLSLILSNSGETEEINRTISQIRSIGCPIIAITSDPNSTLGKHSDVVLPIGAIEEACPLGLAPTTSTTVMLALGDALAMSVLKKQDFTKEQFAFFHPGGKLGRKLMKVSEIMRTGDRHCLVQENTSTRTVIQSMTKTVGRPGAATIIDSKGKLSGIFTDGNLRRLLSEGSDFLDLPISENMTRNPRTVNESNLVADVSAVLAKYTIDQVIIVNDHNEPVGLVDIQDLWAFKNGEY